MMTVGSLFAGIGGLDLGFERAGFEVIWQCERDDFCTRILNKHWPDTPVYDDVQTLYTDDGPSPETPDVLCGGFPCQDISLAGKGAGLDGERSGLWWQYHRIIGVVRPRYAVVENVPALVNRGLPAILGALSEIGYDAEWEIVSAAALGAPHIRERLFLVAYPNSEWQSQPEGTEREGRRRSCNRGEATFSDSDSSRQRTKQRGVPEGEPDTAGQRKALADSDGAGRKEQHASSKPAGTRHRTGSDDPTDMADSAGKRRDTRPGLRSVFSGRQRGRRLYHRCVQEGRQKWQSEPEVDRLADGVPNWVDRLRGLGNAVVPQVAEYVASLVMRHALQTN